MSTLSREEDNAMDSGKNVLLMPSEESSSYPDESELELGLGLSLGSGGVKVKTKKYRDHQYPRVLTAEDFQSGVCTKDSLSSSSSSSSVTKATNGIGSCGMKRTAEPSSPPGRSQVVGWPPVRTYRMNSISNYGKSPVTEDLFSSAGKCHKSDNNVVDATANGCKNDNSKADEKGQKNKASLFVKVNMDGMAIGRKVDLNAHSCYGTLALVLDDMFAPSSTLAAKRQNVEEQVASAGKKKTMRLLDASSDYVLTYEDKDGDWMLVGDVPWEMFLNSVKRLRIMKKNEANGIAPKIMQE